jgi:hypothetical protein
LAQLAAGGSIERLGGTGELARFEYADYYTGTRLLLRRRNFCAKFHATLTLEKV